MQTPADSATAIGTRTGPSGVGHDVGGGITQIFAVQPIKAMQTPILRRFVMAVLDIGAFRLIVQRGLYRKDHLDAELLEIFSKPVQIPI